MYSRAAIISDHRKFAELFQSSLSEDNLDSQIFELSSLDEFVLSRDSYNYLFFLFLETPPPDKILFQISTLTPSAQTKVLLLSVFDTFAQCEFIFQTKLNFRILHIPHLFGSFINPNLLSLKSFLAHIPDTSPPQIEYSPVSETEALPYIKKSLFSANTKHQSFVLLSKHSFSLHNISFPATGGFNISFNKSSIKSKDKILIFSSTPDSLLLDQLNHQFQTTQSAASYTSPFVQTLSPAPSPPPVPPDSTPESTLSRIESLLSQPSLSSPLQPASTPSKKPSSRLHFLSLVFILIFYSLLLVSSGFLSKHFLTQTITHFKSQKFSQAQSSLTKSYFPITIFKFISSPLRMIPLPPLQSYLDQFQLVSLSYPHLVNLSSQLATLESQSGDLFQSLITDQISLKPEQINFKSSVSELDQSLSELQQLFASYPKSPFSSFTSTFSQARLLTSRFQPLLSSLPSLLGFDKERTYFLLFQNGAEIRATGGFIGSSALLTLKSARITDFQVFDIYSLDGQLKGHVEPPSAIKTHLGEAGWYLRDSNWDPDFPTSATQAMWFLDKEIDRKVDGVIALNLEFVKSLLTITGPVQVLDFKETITSDNLFQRAQYQSESEFFPGSTNKKDFLGSLAQSLLNSLKDLDSTKRQSLAAALVSSWFQKDLQFFSPLVISQLNHTSLDHSLRLPNCPTTDCIVTPITVIDSNVGVNKTNGFLTREQQITLDHTPDSLRQQLIINYHNHSTSNNWPMGRYKNYLRIYLHPLTQIDSIQITSNNTTQTITKFDSTLEHGHRVIGFVFEVPISQSSTVTLNSHITYTTAPHSLYLQLQKQSSTRDSVKVQFSSATPINLARTITISGRSQPIALTQESDLLYNLTLSEDTTLQFEFNP